jgi:hypothetical protein
MFEDLDLPPWGEVNHAQGPATDAPQRLRDLDSEDTGRRVAAVDTFLFGAVYYQFTVYPATAFVIPFVIEALGSPTLAARDDGHGHPMAYDLLHFLACCAASGQRALAGQPHPQALTIEQAVTAGVSVFENYLRHPDGAVRKEAALLWCFCREHLRVHWDRRRGRR